MTAARPAGPLSVLKFGGSSFATPQAYRLVARYLAERVARGERLCVVVSVMSGTTGRLSELLHALVPAPEHEDLDAVLGTGEILASALVRAVLVGQGVEAISLNAFQLGWRASSQFAAGRLEDIPSRAITEALARAPVVVISGGQAATHDGRLVMLGRNSSDLTAIAVAAAMQCEVATIFSDVEGVFTADPYRLPNTATIPQLGYRFARAYSEWGAKVLHSGCVDFAERHQVLIRCGTLRPDGAPHFGTTIGAEGRGVQVCLPEHIAICRAASDLPTFLSTIRELDAGSASTPVAGWRDHYAVSSVDALRRLVARGVAVAAQDCLPIVAFALDGRMTVHGARATDRLAHAQAIHDDLVADTAFPRPSGRLEKRRSSHSGIFGNLAPEEAS